MIRGSSARLWRSIPLLCAAALAAAGCAPSQRVPLEVSPPGVRVFVDGEEVEPVPPTLELRSDRAHKLFFKREGHRPELVVLRSVERGGASRLEPGTVRVRLAPLRTTEAGIEIEEEQPPASP